MIINLIRHGKTAGNTEKRYIGRTDEPLCPDGIAELKKHNYPSCDVVVASPMKRCIQTAEIIYHHNNIVIYDDLRECDFGIFEVKNYRELSGSPEYQKWIDSNGTATFPDGENPFDFRKRCVSAFLTAVEKFSNETISFVVHGGTVMSVMERFSIPKRNYYDYQIRNGHGFVVKYANGKITILEEI